MLGYGYMTELGEYDEEAHARDVRQIWKCTRCGDEREEEPGFNDDAPCVCGGRWKYTGESYDARRW